MEKKVKELEAIARDNKEKLSVMNQTVIPMYEAMKMKMVQILTHPHDEFMFPDILLQKLNGKGGTYLTVKEMDKLEELMKERERDQHPDVTPEERLAAAALPIIIKLAVIEKQTPDPVTSIQLVSTTIKLDAEK